MADEATNINSLYGGNYLKVEDVPAAGTLECTVAKTFIKEFQDGTKKLVVEMPNGKWLTLNSTNAKRLAKNFGTDNYTQWVGKTFRVKKDETEFGGRDVPCIRVVKEADAA